MHWKRSGDWVGVRGWGRRARGGESDGRWAGRGVDGRLEGLNDPLEDGFYFVTLLFSSVSYKEGEELA